MLTLRRVWDKRFYDRPCRKDDHACQYALGKAIRWCRGEARVMRGLRYAFNSPW